MVGGACCYIYISFHPKLVEFRAIQHRVNCEGDFDNILTAEQPKPLLPVTCFSPASPVMFDLGNYLETTWLVGWLRTN